MFSDRTFHRSGLCIMGGPEAVSDAVFALVQKAVARINLASPERLPFPPSRTRLFTRRGASTPSSASGAPRSDAASSGPHSRALRPVRLFLCSLPRRCAVQSRNQELLAALPGLGKKVDRCGATGGSCVPLAASVPAMAHGARGFGLCNRKGCLA